MTDLSTLTLTKIESFTSKKDSFTAYDITLSLRQDLGRDIDIPHSDINKIIGETYWDQNSHNKYMYGYNRRSIVVSSGKTAMEYFYDKNLEIKLGPEPSDAFSSRDVKYKALNTNIPDKVDLPADGSTILNNISISVNPFQGSLFTMDDPPANIPPITASAGVFLKKEEDLTPLAVKKLEEIRQYYKTKNK